MDRRAATTVRTVIGLLLVLALSCGMARGETVTAYTKLPFGDFSYDLIPDADATRSLGTADLQWLALYVNSIVLGDDGIVLDGTLGEITTLGSIDITGHVLSQEGFTGDALTAALFPSGMSLSNFDWEEGDPDGRVALDLRSVTGTPAENDWFWLFYEAGETRMGVRGDYATYLHNIFPSIPGVGGSVLGSTEAPWAEVHGVTGYFDYLYADNEDTLTIGSDASVPSLTVEELYGSGDGGSLTLHGPLIVDSISVAGTATPTATPSATPTVTPTPTATPTATPTGCIVPAIYRLAYTNCTVNAVHTSWGVTGTAGVACQYEAFFPLQDEHGKKAVITGITISSWGYDANNYTTAVYIYEGSATDKTPAQLWSSTTDIPGTGSWATYTYVVSDVSSSSAGLLPWVLVYGVQDGTAAHWMNGNIYLTYKWADR